MMFLGIFNLFQSVINRNYAKKNCKSLYLLGILLEGVVTGMMKKKIWKSHKESEWLYCPSEIIHDKIKRKQKRKESYYWTGDHFRTRNVDIKWSPTNVWGSTCMHKEKPRAQIPLLILHSN